MRPTLSIVLLAYGPEPYLGEAVAAVLASSNIDLELIVVDNGCTTDAVQSLPEDPRMTVLTPDTNLGFTGGVNLGMRSARGRYVGTVNSDAIVAPDALSLLVAHLEAHPNVGIAGAAILLADQPDTINSAGLPLHVLGLSWAGKMGQPVSTLAPVESPVAASGATLILRRELWDRLGGFPEEYFAYFEDLELCWHTRQLGLDVNVLAAARSLHHYEFSRSPLKMYLLERNRWLLLRTCFERRTLRALALPLFGFEVAIFLESVLQGWGGQKIKGWRWQLGHRKWIRERRAWVQAERLVPDAALLQLLSDTFDPAQTPLPAAAAPLEKLLQAYWRRALKRLT